MRWFLWAPNLSSSSPRISFSLCPQESQTLVIEKEPNPRSLHHKFRACSTPLYVVNSPEDSEPYNYLILSLRYAIHLLIIRCSIMHIGYIITPNSTVSSSVRTRLVSCTFLVNVIALNMVYYP